MATPPSPESADPRSSLITESAGPRLLWEADVLLALIPELRATGFVADLPGLREKLAAKLADFRARARRDGIERTRVERATEVLAALLDQVVTSMPWGAEAGWQSLRAAPLPAEQMPQGAAQRLLEVARKSFSDVGMRELISVALALGFEAESPGADDVQINQLRAQLGTRTPRAGARIERELSPQWQSSVERGSGLASGWLPLWVSSAVAAAALIVLFFALESSLAVKSDHSYARVMTLAAPPTQEPRSLPAGQPRLAGILSMPNVAVRDEIDRSVIVVPGVQLFAAGSATLLPGGMAFLRPIAEALEHTSGRIQVIGHTDGGSERSARYPSDWDLSVDRARTIVDALHGLGIAGSRMTFDGRAGSEPEAAEGPAQRRDDGRVELVLLAGR
jgi:type VI secretion system protein ImpK